MAAAFDFISLYRELDASASREIVDARYKSFKNLEKTISTTDKIYDLCRIAYQIAPFSAPSWFENPIRKEDPHFVAATDKVDAGRMATLLLRQRFLSAGSFAPLAVLAASFSGRRRSTDNDTLTKLANEAFHGAVRGHRVANGVGLAAPKDFLAEGAKIDALNSPSPVAGALVMAALEAVAEAGDGAITDLFNKTEQSMNSARADIRRLAEEVDMLWWCIGDWHDLLDRPRAETAVGVRMIVSGIELGTMVRQLPGPFGAHGILRRISSGDADASSSLRAALKSLDQQDSQKLAKEVPPASMPLFPIHAAIQLVAQHGAGWEAAFDKIVPGIASMKMSPFELGVQAFRERALLGHGGVN
jgi:hypothetical protein